MSDGRLERSDSERIILPSYVTNNLPLVALLLAPIAVGVVLFKVRHMGGGDNVGGTDGEDVDEFEDAGIEDGMEDDEMIELVKWAGDAEGNESDDDNLMSKEFED